VQPVRIDPTTRQRIAAPASDPAHLFRSAREAAIAAARVISRLDTTLHEYGANIIREKDQHGNVIGYSYGQIEEGPMRPNQREILAGKTSAVKFASLTNPNNLAGTIHSHPPDMGAGGIDRDHRAQMALMNGMADPNAPAGAFSHIGGGDIENNIRDQESANRGNPTPFQQEHYLMTSSGHIWGYRPDETPVPPYSYSPENAFDRKHFFYAGRMRPDGAYDPTGRVP
jgi:hypothetical protein